MRDEGAEGACSGRSYREASRVDRLRKGPLPYGVRIPTGVGTFRRSRRATRVATAVLACAVLAGCAAESSPPEHVATFSEVVDVALQEAVTGGAGETQLAILRQAQKDGSLTVEDTRAAARSAVDCMNAAGFSATYGEQKDDSGLIVPEYTAGFDAGQDISGIDTCDQQEFFWVNMVYQTQPLAVEKTDARLEQQAPVIRKCLEGNGYTTDPSSSPRDLARQASKVAQESNGAVDCLAEAGISGF